MLSLSPPALAFAVALGVRAALVPGVETPPPLALEREVVREAARARVRWVERPRDGRLQGVQGYARVLPEERVLVLRWTQGWDVHRQREPLPFTPTALCQLDDRFSGFGRLAVAGVDDAGNTLVHVRRYALARDEGGELADALLAQDERVFRAGPLAPHTVVDAMWRDVGSTEHVYVLLRGSRTVQRIDFARRSARVVAAARGAGDFVTLPELARHVDFVYARDHVHHGFVYSFYGGDEPGLPVLRDRDRDGVPEDAFVVRSTEEFFALGLGDSDLYVE